MSTLRWHGYDLTHQQAQECIDNLQRQLANANAHVAALTAALVTRRSACNEESERADEAERQLAEARSEIECLRWQASISTSAPSR